MDHIKIWLQIITLIAGAGVLIKTYQIYSSYRYQFLKHLLWFFLFINLSLFFDTLSHYLLINFFNDLHLFKSSGFMKINEPLAILFNIGKLYFLIALLRSFQNKQPYKKLHRLLICCAVFILINVLLSLFVVLPSTISNVLGVMYSGIYVFVFLLFYCILSKLVVERSFKIRGKKLFQYRDCRIRNAFEQRRLGAAS